MRGLYAIVDTTQTNAAEPVAAARDILRAGACLLQYRNKTASWQQRLAEAGALSQLCADYGVPLIVNDDVTLCLACNAGGVHIGQSDTPLAETRAQLGPEAIIGVTCHASLELARAAQQGGANYVAFGRFFPSISKPHAPPANIAVLTRASAELSIPIVAIGGINAQNGRELIEAGADMLAVINYLFSGGRIIRRAQELTALFHADT